MLLHKKAKRENLKNYRSINILSVIYRLLTKIVARRLETILDSAQPKEQVGFRSRYSTMDNIQVLQQVIEQCNGYEIPLCVAFVDFDKAFDCIMLSTIFKVLQRHGIEEPYISLLKSVYTNATVTLHINDDTNAVNIREGIRQGNTILPKLFSVGPEEIFKRLNWSRKGIKVNVKHLIHLRFADEAVIFSQSAENLQTRINESSNLSGLKMNLKKT